MSSCILADRSGVAVEELQKMDVDEFSMMNNNTVDGRNPSAGR